MVVLLMPFLCMVNMVFVFWGVGRILGNVYKIWGQNYVALLQGSKMQARLHFRNLILGIQCFRILSVNVCCNIYLLFNSDIMNYLLRTKWGRDRRPDLLFYIYLLFNSDIVNYLLRTNGGKTESFICYLHSLECFNY